MKRLTPVVLFATLFVASLPAQTLVWTGTGVNATGAPVGSGTGWRGEVTPTGSGTENVYLGSALNGDILLPANFAVNTVTLAHDDEFRFNPLGGSATLTLAGGLVYGGNPQPGSLLFGPNVTLNVPGAQAFDVGINQAIVSGQITGSGALTLRSGFNGSYAGGFIFNNTGAGNTNTGPVTLDLANGGFVAFWNSNPFGSGAVTLTQGGGLIAHGSQTVANAFTLSSSTPSAVSFRSWDNKLVLSGAVTLANNTTLSVQTAVNSVEAGSRDGNIPQAGALKRNPIVFSGNIGESGGVRSLTIGGPGLAIFTGTNSYSGGTSINGSLVFGTNSAIPSGTNNVSVNTQGYVGFGDLSAGNFATQLGQHVNVASSGAVGVDTLPGNATAVFSDNINLSGFTNASIRFGTATSAILTGTFTPKGANYQFGNGGGSLYVQSNLANSSAALSLNNESAVPLKLYLQGANTYTGGTIANAGFVIFDGASALPATGWLQANGSASALGGSYIGYTDSVGITPATFVGRFNQAGTWGVIGFDTHAGNSTAVINGVDLTGFNDGVYLGTATSATLTGTLTPAVNTLRFTAGNGGTLTINTDLGAGTPSRAVVFGSSLATTNSAFSNGTIALPVASTHTGGTTINGSAEGLTMAIGNSAAFGTGGITIGGAGNGNVAFTPTTGAINVSNPLTFDSYANLGLYGSSNLKLSGDISGSGSIYVMRGVTDTYGSATLAGDNSNFDGFIGVQHATLGLEHNHAAGNAQVTFFDSTATVAFSGAATAPVIHGISGDKGFLVVPNGAALTFDTSDDSLDAEFGGTISGDGGAPTSASITVYSSNGNGNTLYLFGHNNYTGGTTITGSGILGLGASDSAGTGPITINTGGLILNAGVTLTNPLVYNSGALAGIGTYSPSSVSGTGQTANTITFGTNQKVYPGVPADDAHFAGTLTFGTNVAFAPGGTYHVMLQDPTGTGQHSLLVTTGNLDLSLLGASSFLFEIETLDAMGGGNYTSAFALGQGYHIPIVQAAAITGTFSPGLFSFDATEFQGGLLPSTIFSLSADATHLYLDFTPVPEPSTWALLVTGTGLLGFAARRRRR